MSGKLDADFTATDVKVGGPLGALVQGVGWLAGKVGSASPSSDQPTASPAPSQAEAQGAGSTDPVEGFEEYAQMTGANPQSDADHSPAHGNDGVSDTDSSLPNPDPSQPPSSDGGDGPTALACTDDRETYGDGGSGGHLPTGPSVDQPEPGPGDRGAPSSGMTDPSSPLAHPDGRDDRGATGPGLVDPSRLGPSVSQPTTEDVPGAGGPGTLDPGRVEPVGPVG